MRTLDLFKIFSQSKGFEKWVALSLAIIFGLSIPAASIFFKIQAINRSEFLFFGVNFFSVICMWICAIGSITFSLHKTFQFIQTAFGSKILAILSCISLEMAFLHSDGIWFCLFCLPIIISNIVQATVGFLTEESKENLPKNMPQIQQKIEKQDEFWQDPGQLKENPSENIS